MKIVSLSTFLFLSSSFSLGCCMSRRPEPDYELGLPPVHSKDANLATTSGRKSKLFPYFLIQFPNEHCTSPEGSGVCVSHKECRSSGGTTIGVCAQGFGTCCRFVRSCLADGGDVQVRENATEIRNGSSACRFVLPKGRNICQARLDFKEFQYGIGLPSGDCSDTKITIGGGMGGPIDLCGNMTGQHLYLNYGSSDKIYINSHEPSSEQDQFSIQITYIRCNSRQAVPPHCAQVHTGMEGQIQSFNWPQQQLNNQEYTVCVNPPESESIARSQRSRNSGRILGQSRFIEWTTCGNKLTDFLLSGNRSDPRVLDPSNCDTDYVQVFGGNRQCGNSFKNETITTAPYLLSVKFDGSEMVGKFAEQMMLVGKPAGEECETLNTKETICSEVVSQSQKKEEGKGGRAVCRCMRNLGGAKRRLKPDVGNTGFCLAYKIVDL